MRLRERSRNRAPVLFIAYSEERERHFFLDLLDTFLVNPDRELGRILRARGQLPGPASSSLRHRALG